MKLADLSISVLGCFHSLQCLATSIFGYENYGIFFLFYAWIKVRCEYPPHFLYLFIHRGTSWLIWVFVNVRALSAVGRVPVHPVHSYQQQLRSAVITRIQKKYGGWVWEGSLRSLTLVSLNKEWNERRGPLLKLLAVLLPCTRTKLGARSVSYLWSVHLVWPSKIKQWARHDHILSQRPKASTWTISSCLSVLQTVFLSSSLPFS